MDPFKIFTPSPILGYGYDIDEFWATIRNERPAAIIVDGGSTDPGPYMLGTGKTICSKQSYVRDLAPILDACYEGKIKLLVGSAGGAGTNAQVDFMVDIINELAVSRKQQFKIATIKFKEDRSAILGKLSIGCIAPCGPGPALTEGDVTQATVIVAQMGAEPYLEVLKDETVDLIIAGRSYDPAPFAAFCLSRGVDASPAWHMGKIMECGGLCAVPKGRSMLATIYKDRFELTPPNSRERCTPLSVAAHTLYEKTRPDRLPGPGGVLYLDDAEYIQQPDDRTVLIKGSRFVPSTVYQIKLEGAEKIGFRTVFIGGIRDPILIRGIEKFLETVRSTTQAAFPTLGRDQGTQLIFHVYGKNAVMGPLEPSQSISHEIGLLGEVFAQSQQDADAIAGFARTVALHGAYEGQLATAGNLASPLTPLEQSAGPVYKFSVYHLMDVQDPRTFFEAGVLQAGISDTRPEDREGQVFRSRNAVLSLTTSKTMSAIIQTKPTRVVPRGAVKLADIASVIRSKNSGPYEITLDILFDSEDVYQRVKSSDALTHTTIKRLYQLADADILTLMFYQPALAWKCTFKRPWPQGSVGERDTFGAQQHAPLLSIIVGPEKEHNNTKL